ncbi:MAG: DNA primase [Clostridia bacterium]|nr:DNA primase [Clostridia bacterium]
MAARGEHYISTEEVLSAVNIVSLVGQYVPLKKQGANYVGLCPFHSDRRPSLFVSEQKQIFKCFVCDVGGNAVRFVSLADKLPYQEALRKVADYAGIKYAKFKEVDDTAVKLHNDIRALNKEAARFFFENLKTSEKPQKYLVSRGLLPETVTKFGIGYAPDSWDALYRHFKAQGISDELILKAGLAGKNSDGTGFIDRFHDRLMFPIFDEMGNVIAFGGRIMDPEAKTAKYINSQETPIYVKGDHLYGLNLAKKSSEKTAIIVEGYMDCIALHQKGIDFAVASLGTALTIKQAKLLKRFFNDVIVAFDNDNAGRDATVRSLDILKEAGLGVKVFRLEGAKDADEFLRKHTKDEFLAQLSNSRSLFEYKALIAAEKYPAGTNENTIGFLNQIKRLLASLPETDRDVYTHWVFEHYNESYGFTKDMLSSRAPVKEEAAGKARSNRIFLPDSEYGVPGGDDVSEEAKRADLVDKSFMILLSENPEFYKKTNESEIRNLLTSEVNREIFDKVYEGCEKGTIRCFRDIPPISPTADNALAGAYLGYNISKENASKAFSELLFRMKSRTKRDRLSELQKLLDDPDVPKADKMKYLKEFQELNAKKQLKA